MLLKIKMAALGIMVSFIIVLPVFVQAKPVDSPKLIINLPSRTIELYSGKTLVKEYPVAIGRPSTPTPLGNFSILSKEINPAWYPPYEPKHVVPSGPNNPLGYRWMGFISTKYGIHGTNDPNSIGRVVSNGCVRMHESDVEELFDLVSRGTPLNIVYDRVRIFLDNSGQAKISVYPDVYGYGKLTVASVRKQLKKYAWNSFITDDYLRGVIAAPGKAPVNILKTFQVKVNGVILSQRGVIANDSAYIPVDQVAGSLNIPVLFDGKYITCEDGSKVPAVVSDDTVYVSAEDMKLLFGGHPSWQDNNNCWSLDKISVFFNQKPSSLDPIKIGGIPAIAVKELAKVLNRKGNWDESSQIFHLDNSETPPQNPAHLILNEDIDMIDSEPFLKITKINEHFDTFVYWNSDEYYIELIYPKP